MAGEHRRKAAKMLHEFTLVLSATTLSDGQCEDLYAAGLDDGTISTSQGVTRIDVDREAVSLESAISSAIGQVNAAGLSVARVEMEPDRFTAEVS
jgi:hypothetical protein